MEGSRLGSILEEKQDAMAYAGRSRFSMSRLVVLLVALAWIVVFTGSTVALLVQVIRGEALFPVEQIQGPMAWLGVAIIFALPVKSIVDRVPGPDAIEALKAMAQLVSASIPGMGRASMDPRTLNAFGHGPGYQAPAGMPLDSDPSFSEREEG